MSTDYRPLITNPATSIHDDMRSARRRLHSVVELLEQGRDTEFVDETLIEVMDAPTKKQHKKYREMER